MYFLHPAIHHYDWGDYHFIPAFLNTTETGKPFAELWYGTHARGDSRLPELHTSLREYLDAPLPYLLKILAARTPLSIQVHPTKAQAETGFAKEEARDIALDAPHRNYRDPNHKPEMLVALSEVWALSSFRSFDEIEKHLSACAIPLQEKSEGALRSCIDLLLHEKNSTVLLEKVLRYAREQVKQEFDVHWWVLELATLYPSDIGAMMPYVLNLVRLREGEALLNGAGELHSYLRGSGVELMANSDNVLRCACTNKHRDIEELCAVTSFTPRTPQIVEPRSLEDGVELYPVPIDDFVLYRIGASKPVSCPIPGGTGILLCTEGKVHIRDKNRHCEITKGDALFCMTTHVKIEGRGEIFVATHAMHLD